jgi:hypothetical protein
MLENFLIICYTTPNYERITEHFLNCLDTITVPKANICIKRDIPPVELMSKEGFKSNLWYYCLITKLKHLIDSLILNKGKYDYYISSDCDIQFLYHHIDKWYDLEQYMKTNNKDIYFMREGLTEEVNGGFYIICNRNLDSTINFLKSVYEEMLITPYSKMELGDQTIINKKIIGMTNIGKIPLEYVVWGHDIYDHTNSLVHHAVQTSGTIDKIAQMKKINDYLE